MLSLVSKNARLFLGCALFLSALFAPPFVTAIISLVLALRWRAWEVIAAGIFMDFLWLPDSYSFTSFESFPLLTVISMVVVIGLEPLRRLLLAGTD